MVQNRLLKRAIQQQVVRTLGKYRGMLLPPQHRGFVKRTIKCTSLAFSRQKAGLSGNSGDGFPKSSTTSPNNLRPFESGPLLCRCRPEVSIHPASQNHKLTPQSLKLAGAWYDPQAQLQIQRHESRPLTNIFLMLHHFKRRLIMPVWIASGSTQHIPY